MPQWFMWKLNLEKTTSNMLLISHYFGMMPYERPALLKAYNKLLNVTLLEDLSTLLEVGLLKGLWTFTWNVTLLKDLQMAIKPT